MESIINGIGVGFFSAFFISLYLDAFIGISIPIYISYLMIAPLFSAISILIILYIKKERKKESGLEWWEEGKPRRKV